MVFTNLVLYFTRIGTFYILKIFGYIGYILLLFIHDCLINHLADKNPSFASLMAKRIVIFGSLICNGLRSVPNRVSLISL